MADSLEAFPVSNLHQYDITLVYTKLSVIETMAQNLLC